MGIVNLPTINLAKKTALKNLKDKLRIFYKKKLNISLTDSAISEFSIESIDDFYDSVLK